MSARPVDASVAPLALSDDERSPQPNMQHVENPRRGSYVLVTPRNDDAQQEIHWCAELASEMGILSVATSSSAQTQRNCSGRV